MPQALKAADKIQLRARNGPGLAEATLRFWAAIRFYGLEARLALKAFLKSIALNPGYRAGSHWYGVVSCGAGAQNSDSITEDPSWAREIDPRDP